jgi:thymidylate synthase
MRQYLDLLKHIKENGDGHNDRTGVGTKSVFGYQFRCNLDEGFPLLTTKRLAFRWIAEELFWFISGSTNNSKLRERGGEKPITIWDEWATEEKCAEFGREEGDLGPVYGHTWRNFGATYIDGEMIRGSGDYPAPEVYDNPNKRWINFGYMDDGFDQFKINVMDQLRDNPRSRRIILSGWDPRDAGLVALPPCHTLCQFKWHEETNKLDCQLYQRSADVFLGVPYNIASYALLTSLLARSYDMLPGEYVHTFGDVHIYNTHPSMVDEQLERKPRPLPGLEISKQSDPRNYTYDDLKLLGYDPMPSIKAPVAV